MMKGRLRKLCSFALTFMLLFGVLGFGAQDVNASVVKKIVKSYDVAVVFDNSGSMYNDTDAWCKAKYAMEVFAYMMNYGEKQSLKVYPMWEVETGGDTSGTFKPFEINDPKDVDQIHDMYTLTRGETPFEPVRNAYKDLQKSKADEKWLIVLTDGSFNKDNRDDAAKTGAVDPQKELAKMADGDINVQYLALGEEADTIQADEAAGLYATKATNKSLNTDLINICNTIFQRATLPKDCIKGDKLNLDMSMRNIIVFAQGKNVKVKSLRGSKEVEKKDSRDCKYSTKSTDGKYADKAKVDKTLSGQVVTFGSCKRGSYELDMKNVDKDNLEIFYEPDVNIKVTLQNSTKNNAKPVELTNAEGFTTGDYTINYALIDNQTDKDVSNSDLLGKVTYVGKLVYSNGEKKTLKPGDPFKLKPDGEAFVDVSATYLKNYVISTGASDQMKDAYTIKVDKAAAKKLKMELEVMQGGNWYQLKKHDEWKPVRAHLKYDGKEMTDEQLDAVKMDCRFGDSNMVYRTEPVHGESAVDIYLGEKEGGKYVEPDAGKYTMAADASYTAKFSKASKASENAKFRVASFGKWLWWLTRILPILALLAFLIWWNFRKSFPRKAYFNNKMGRTPLKVKSKSINLSSNNYPGELICDGEKVTSHIGRKKKNAKFVAKNLNPDAAVQSFTIGFGNEFTKDGSGDFVDTFGNKLTPQTKFTISDNTEIVWNKKGKTRKGTITINH